MTLASKRFEVNSSGFSNLTGDNTQLANLTDNSPIPDDEQRLRYMYTNYGPQATFDPNTGQFLPAQSQGGYNALTNINYGQNEIDSAPGDVYNIGGVPFQVPIPRTSPIDEGQFGVDNSNGCPAGFYQFGKVCVPDTSLNPNSVGSELNVNTGVFGTNGILGGDSNFGKGAGKGIILAITPPQFTELNQEFIVLTDMQNIGGTAAKFYTSISIPDINLTASTSNSTMVMPLAKMKIGHRVIMPSTVTSQTLLSATVQLIQVPISYSGTANPTTQIDDTGKVNIPAPGYRGPLPPMGGGVAGTTGAGVGTPPGGFGGGPTLLPPPPFMPTSGSGSPFPGMGGTGAFIQVTPYQTVYNPYQTVYVSGGGFYPGEPIALQIYNVSNMNGLSQFGSRLSSVTVYASGNGSIGPNIPLTLPYPGSGNLAIIAYGSTSTQRAQFMLPMIPVSPFSSPFSTGININL